jgi:hypothetical protein
LNESEAFVCKALKGEAIVNYCEPLITQQMKASDSCKVQVIYQHRRLCKDFFTS